MDERVPDCCCEQVSVSPFSPCPIQPNEKLASVITKEKYFNSDTKIIRSTIADRLHDGLSVDRIKYSNKNNFEKIANEIVSYDSENEFFGVVCFSTSGLRNINHKGHRCFAVYDTALQENVSHAEVIQTNYPSDPKLAKNERKEIRRIIRSRITEAIEYEKKMVSLKTIFQEKESF